MGTRTRRPMSSQSTLDGAYLFESCLASERPRERLVGARRIRAELGRAARDRCSAPGAAAARRCRSGSAAARRGRVAAAHGDAAGGGAHGDAGVGTARAVTVHAALELGRRLAAEAREEGAPVRSPRDVAAAVRATARGPAGGGVPRRDPRCAAPARARRDGHARILNSSLVHPREVFREAIAERAAAIILVHNHPSGDPTPSRGRPAGDGAARGGGRLLDIPVHDHVIIGRGRYTSFRGGRTACDDVPVAADSARSIPGWQTSRRTSWRERSVSIADLLARAYRFSEQAHRGPDAQLRRAVRHALRRGREDPRRPAARHHHGRQRAHPRRRRGHGDHGRRRRARVRQGDRADRRRADEDRQAARQRLEPGPAGRELPQAAALDREGCARHHHQARRPAAQHAHAGLPAARRSGAASRRRRATCTRRSRTASAWRRCGGSSRTSRSSTSSPTTTRRWRSRSRRSAASARS